MRDDILSYREMCDAEEIQTLQRGMNFRMSDQVLEVRNVEGPAACRPQGSRAAFWSPRDK
jgi:hypothetical protein